MGLGDDRHAAGGTNSLFASLQVLYLGFKRPIRGGGGWPLIHSPHVFGLINRRDRKPFFFPGMDGIAAGIRLLTTITIKRLTP